MCAWLVISWLWFVVACFWLCLGCAALCLCCLWCTRSVCLACVLYLAVTLVCECGVDVCVSSWFVVGFVCWLIGVGARLFRFGFVYVVCFVLCRLLG